MKMCPDSTNINRFNSVGHLEIGRHDAIKLATEFGTPLYVFNEDMIRQSCRSYRDSLHKYYPHESRVAYAAKAFLVTAMCKVIEQQGVWLDVASLGELYTALQAGFPMSHV